MISRITKLLLQTIITFLLFALALFIPAGSSRWLNGWIFLILFFGWFTLVNLWLLKHNPGLLEERFTLGRSDQKGWDKILFPFLLILSLAWLVFISLDATHSHWSPVPSWLELIGGIIMVCSFILIFLTFRENSYLSTVVRVQQDRGHAVVSTGVYHYVRHPMYSSFILFFFGASLLLGSWYGVLFGVVYMIVLARRAVLEELTLQKELTGYEEYMTKVKYRIIPFVW